MKQNPEQYRCARAPLIERAMRLVMCCLTAMAATPAFAQLVPVGETTAAVNYIDSTNVSKNGDLRSVWVILDLKKPSAAGARSIRALNEFQ